MPSNVKAIGRWAFIIGIILAVLAGFTKVPFLATVLFALGLIVGLLNIKEKENTSFLVAVVTLLLIGVAGLQLGKLTTLIASILEKFIAMVAAAGLVIAIKQVVSLARPNAR